MKTTKWYIGLIIIVLCLGLTACITDIWTGANIIYDRHTWYRKFNDFQLGSSAKRALYADQRFKCSSCSIEIAVFHGDILLAGHVPTQTMYQEINNRIQAIPGKRRFYNELAVHRGVNDPILDSWITTKIRSAILADASIDPNLFKIVTVDQIVYLMGDVLPEQAEAVIEYARQWNEVRRVVKLFRYYHLSQS